MKKLPWLLAFTFLGISAFLFYNFVFKGDGIIEPDGRISIEISLEEKELFFKEMRGFLTETKNLSNGILEKDVDKIITAGTVGRGIIDRVPASLMRKLPLAFKKVGFSTQNQFKEIARMAEKGADFDELLNEYNNLLKKCVACHIKYKMNVSNNN